MKPNGSHTPCRPATSTDFALLWKTFGYSNTVTTFEVPEGHTAEEILHKMRYDHNILLAGSFGCFAGKLIRIGHMGENANEADVVETLEALKSVLNKLSA